jgi:DNA-binding transcriptional regulator LsrR (DeoR family)
VPKKPITREKLRQTVRRDWGDLSHDEVVAAACKYFCRGYTANDVKTELKATLGLTLSREDPYRLLSFAGSRGWLEFRAPMAYDLVEKIQKAHPWLEKVAVLRTAVSDDISYHTARMLLDLVRQLRDKHPRAKTVRVGFAGGTALRKTARRFAEMLREPQDGLPQTIIFHAMVAGFDSKDTTAEPNAFFAYFVDEPELQVKTGFVGLHAPGMVKTASVRVLRALDHVRESFQAAKNIDIIVTSAGGHWRQGHSALHDMYAKSSPKSLEVLNKAGCVGDMMWRPLGPDGPLEMRTDVRTMTLMELSQLPEFIHRGGKVLLLLGPCGASGCGGPKADVFRAILRGGRKVTHVCVDSRTAKGMLEPA